MAAGISSKDLSQIKTAFNTDSKNLLAQNVCTQYDLLDVCLDRKVVEKVNHIFKHKVAEVKPVTNQKSSGRCWIFALLNVIRQKFVETLNLEEFEFSQQYLFFWDKIERSFFFINTFEDLAQKGEKANDRLMMFLLSNPMDDGGQWGMLVNVVEKYGLVPKAVWPDSVNAGKSRHMNTILNTKLREFVMQLQTLVGRGCSKEDLHIAKIKMMTEIYRIVAICLGSPPETFDWEYYDKTKKHHKMSGITPQQFYQDHVKPVFNVQDKVCVVNDPRNPYNKMYTVQYLSNMNGKIVKYNNQPIQVLKNITAASIRDNEAVWFGCDVGKHFQRKHGALDLAIHDYSLAFGVSMLGLDKSQRLVYGQSMMTHAMVFTGLSWEDAEDKPEADEGKVDKTVTTAALKTTKWRVENSWGDADKEKGFLMMTDEWFSEFVFEVVVDKKYLPTHILAIEKEEPFQLPAWDPMGALACSHCGQQ